jgi:hypothetical protein
MTHRIAPPEPTISRTGFSLFLLTFMAQNKLTGNLDRKSLVGTSFTPRVVSVHENQNPQA